MTTPNQWAVREVALATFYDLQTGKAKIQLQNLKTSGIENTATKVYAKGGPGNSKIVSFSGDRGGKVTLQDAVFTNEVIGMMTGNDITTGEVVIRRETHQVTGNKVSLQYTPEGVNSVFTLNPDGTHKKEIELTAATLATGKFTLSGKELTFFSGDLPAGTEIVVYYKTEAGATAKKITVSSDKFAGAYKVVLDCLVRDTVFEKDFAAQIVIDKAAMEDNWKIQMQAEGEPSVFDIPLEIIKPAGSTTLYTMTIYDEAELV